jgi:hypothetical protein
MLQMSDNNNLSREALDLASARRLRARRLFRRSRGIDGGIARRTDRDSTPRAGHAPVNAHRAPDDSRSRFPFCV